MTTEDLVYRTSHKGGKTKKLEGGPAESLPHNKNQYTSYSLSRSIRQLQLGHEYCITKELWPAKVHVYYEFDFRLLLCHS